MPLKTRSTGSDDDLATVFYRPQQQTSQNRNRERILHSRLQTAGISYKSLHVAEAGGCLLNLSGTKVTDLSLLIGMPLTHLCLQGCFGIEDFSPLGRMALDWLNLSRTRIVGLTPLARLPLRYLRLWRTKVEDLSPFSQVPLESLDIRFSQVSDLTPLKSVPLRELFFFPQRITQGLQGLRDIRTLCRINGRDPARFWDRRS